MEWRTLATKAIAVRGGPLDPAAIWSDADGLRKWNLANLDDYWVAKTAEGERVPHALWAGWEYGLQWVVLGIARLHHTIATGEVISKSSACGHALAVTDERWHRVVRTAMALRADRQADLATEAEILVADAVAVARWLMADAPPGRHGAIASRSPRVATWSSSHCRAPRAGRRHRSSAASTARSSAATCAAPSTDARRTARSLTPTGHR